MPFFACIHQIHTGYFVKYNKPLCQLYLLYNLNNLRAIKNLERVQMISAPPLFSVLQAYAC